MSRWTLAAVGRLKSASMRELEAEYLKRLKRYADFEVRELRDRGPEAEGERQLEMLERSNGLSVLLSEDGQQLTSRQFAGWLEQRPEGVLFFIGGADGFSKTLRQRVPECLSLSRMTMPHEFARIFFLEQCYRAWTILAGHPYHRD